MLVIKKKNLKVWTSMSELNTSLISRASFRDPHSKRAPYLPFTYSVNL